MSRLTQTKSRIAPKSEQARELLVFLGEIEESIRLGHTREAREKLEALRLPRRLESSTAVRTAALYRRTGLVARGLKLIAPYALEGRDLHATRPDTVLEYAHGLLQSNALLSVRRILSDPALRSMPRTQFLSGLCSMHEWDYEGALEPLETYISQTPKDEYDYWVARVNRLAVLLGLGRIEDATADGHELEERLAERGHRRLLFNATMLEVQAWTHAGRFKEADKALEKVAARGLAALGTIDQLYLEKWRLIARAEAGDLKALDEAQTLRDRAVGPAYSELRRDLDRLIHLHKRDDARLAWMYFATPSRRFRDRLLSESGLAVPSHSDWNFGTDPRTTIDLSNWLRDSAFGLPAKAMVALFRDGYRQPSLLEIFDCIYPDFFCNPATYARNVHQILHRLREQLESEGLPLELVHEGNAFRLCAKRKDGCRIVVRELPDILLRRSADLELFEQLKEPLRSPRSARSLCELTGESLRMTQKRLRHWHDQGLLQVRAIGTALHYQLKIV